MWGGEEWYSSHTDQQETKEMQWCNFTVSASMAARGYQMTMWARGDSGEHNGRTVCPYHRAAHLNSRWKPPDRAAGRREERGRRECKNAESIYLPSPCAQHSPLICVKSGTARVMWRRRSSQLGRFVIYCATRIVHSSVASSYTCQSVDATIDNSLTAQLVPILLQVTLATLQLCSSDCWFEIWVK